MFHGYAVPATARDSTLPADCEGIGSPTERGKGTGRKGRELDVGNGGGRERELWYRENRGEGIKGAGEKVREREEGRQREVEGGRVLEVVEEGVEI